MENQLLPTPTDSSFAAPSLSQVLEPQRLVDALRASAPLPTEAWEALADERSKVPTEELVAFNVDVRAAATAALGAYPEIHALREQALASIVGFDPTCIDRLPLYAAAAAHGQTLFLTSQQEIRELPALYDEAFKLRETFHTDLAPMVRRGLMSADRLRGYNGGVGYQVVAWDLALLISAARQHWRLIAGKSTLTEAELASAERLSQRIVVAVGLRDQGPAVLAAAALERQRAFTLFVRAYDEVRRIVTFLRWREQDAERIAPSLYGPRNRGPRRGTDAATEAGAPTQAPSPATASAAAAESTDTSLPPGMSPFTA